MIKLFSTKRKCKIGLALGSGGAKGVAHIGAIKAFEENGITFDMVAGTSIGSIIGACYASDYTAGDMLALLKATDMSEMQRLIMIKMDTTPLERLLERMLGDITFEELKKPFSCIGTDISTGEGVEFKSGKIIKPITSSCAMPPFFKPVKIDGKLYCDGAFANAIPADRLKARGCDFVVGIDLAQYSEKGKASAVLDMLSYKIPNVGNGRKLGYDNADIMLQPKLKGYTATSIDRMGEMFELGYQIAMEHMEEIKNRLIKLKVLNKKGKMRKPR